MQETYIMAASQTEQNKNKNQSLATPLYAPSSSPKAHQMQKKKRSVLVRQIEVCLLSLETACKGLLLKRSGR